MYLSLGLKLSKDQRLAQIWVQNQPKFETKFENHSKSGLKFGPIFGPKIGPKFESSVPSKYVVSFYSGTKFSEFQSRDQL